MHARRWGYALVLLGLVSGAGAEAPPDMVMGPTETAPAAPLPAASVPFPPPNYGDPEIDAAAQAILDAFAPDPAAPETPQPLDPARVLPRASKLGIPPKPADPERRTRFSVPLADPAGGAARVIARRVTSFKNFR